MESQVTSTPFASRRLQGYRLAGNSSRKPTMRSPGCQSRPRASVAMPSDVFLTSAISLGSAFTRRAESFVDGQPLGIVEAAVVQAILGQVLERIGAAPGERRDGRVIQINQVLAHRELVGVALPQRNFRDAIFYNFRTHSLYNT